MQDVSLGEGQFGVSLESALVDLDCQVECGNVGNTLDGSVQDSLGHPVEEEDGAELNRIEKRSVEENLSNLQSSNIDEVEEDQREAEESEEIDKRKFRGIGKRAKEFKFRGIGKRFGKLGNQVLGKRKYSFRGMSKRYPWLMNESDMAGFEKRRYKIRGVGKRKYKIRGVGKRRQHNFRGIHRDQLGKRPFTFWGQTDPRVAVANRLYMLRSRPEILTEDRNSCIGKDEEFPKMTRFNKFPMGKRLDEDTLRILQTNFPNPLDMGLGEI